MITINGVLFKAEYFPDSTLRLNCEVTKPDVEIGWVFENNEEMVSLYFLVNHLRRVYKVSKLTLNMPYIPNARMDRVKKNNEVFTLKYFCEFINDLKFDSVRVRDAHSNVSLALLNNVISENIQPSIQALVQKLLINENDLVFFPDEGSCKRYSDFINKKCVFGIKKRDWHTGKILGLDVVGDVPNCEFNALIIDDISSYGGTFYHSAMKLRELGANKIWLYVTHCENSILDGDLIKSGLINKIYTTNSIFTKEHELIEII